MGPENRKKPASDAGDGGKTKAAPGMPEHALPCPVPKPLN